MTINGQCQFEITCKITFQTGTPLVEIPMVFITIIFLASLDHNEERHVTTRRKGEGKQAFAWLDSFSLVDDVNRFF